MLLPFTNGLVKTTHFDAEMSFLADRHYSRRTIGARQFLYSGKKIVLRDTEGLVLFGWLWCDLDKRMDAQAGYNCAIFRNESARLSSEIIIEAERFAVGHWGPNRGFTYVDSREIANKGTNYRKQLPGYCFLKAGWDYVRGSEGQPMLSKSGKHLLAKENLANAGVGQEP